jgi:hypothetical protein
VVVVAEYEFLRAGNSEATEKKALSALFATASGVLSGLVVTQTTTASGSVLIASGSALVHPSAVSASLLGNDTSKTLDVFTANPVGGLPRNDIVEFDQITASIIVHVGVPNATPTDPTVPNTSVALARLRHAASATTIPTAKIDTLIVPTVLRGIKAAPLVYTDTGLVTTGTIDVFTTALRTVTDPFGAGVPYRCRTTYFLGYIGGTGSARAWLDTNAVGVRWATITANSSAAPGHVVDMPSGGTVTFRGAIRSLSTTMTTVADPAVHYMVTEVTPL